MNRNLFCLWTGSIVWPFFHLKERRFLFKWNFWRFHCSTLELDLFSAYDKMNQLFSDDWTLETVFLKKQKLIYPWKTLCSLKWVKLFRKRNKNLKGFLKILPQLFKFNIYSSFRCWLLKNWIKKSAFSLFQTHSQCF